MSRPVQEMPRSLLTSVPNWMILCYLPFPSSLLLMFTASNLGTQNEDDPTNTTVSIPFYLSISVLREKHLSCLVHLQLFVGNLDANITDEHLRQVFGNYGQLLHVKIPVGKRCGFVQFADR